MSDFLSSLIGGIVEFFADLFTLRNIRAAKERPTRSWSDDAADTAVLDWWITPLAAVAALLVAAVLYLGLGLPLWLSLGAPAVLAAAYCCYRYWDLIKR